MLATTCGAWETAASTASCVARRRPPCAPRSAWPAPRRRPARREAARWATTQTASSKSSGWAAPGPYAPGRRSGDRRRTGSTDHSLTSQPRQEHGLNTGNIANVAWSIETSTVETMASRPAGRRRRRGRSRPAPPSPPPGRPRVPPRRPRDPGRRRPAGRLAAAGQCQADRRTDQPRPDDADALDASPGQVRPQPAAPCR